MAQQFKFLSTARIIVRGLAGRPKTLQPRVVLPDAELETVFEMAAFKTLVNKQIDNFKQDLKLKYNVRMNPHVLENIDIKYQSEMIKLADIVTIGKRNNGLIINLTATPAAVKPVVAAIHESGLQLSLQQDGDILYLTIPKVTTEHRNNMIKSIDQIGRKLKESIKNRHNQKKFWVKTDKKHGQDMVRNVTENVDYFVKQKEAEIDQIIKRKAESLNV